METNIENSNEERSQRVKKKTLFKDLLVSDNEIKKDFNTEQTPEEREALARYKATRERQSGLFGTLALFFGFKDEKDLKKVQPYLKKINLQ